MKFLFLLYLLIGCTTYRPVDKISKQEYIDTAEKVFYHEASDRGIEFPTKTTIKLVDELPYEFGITTIAVCLYNTNAVFISAEQIKKFTYFEIEVTVLHELGHCQLLRRHDESTIVTFYGQVAKSIMFPRLSGISIPYYYSNRTYYLNELFNKDVTDEQN